MPLEAITALLGRKTMTMTLVSARIADKTVADQYFSGTEKVQARYQQQRPRPYRSPTNPHRSETPRRRPTPDARERLLRPAGRTRLPLRNDLRILHLLRHHHRLQTHPQGPRGDDASTGQTGVQKSYDGFLERLVNTGT
jgi:hypothetical protein